MPRRIPPERLTDLVACATRVFIERGYRRTQMADVAEALGVAKGTLYLYVASKEALFDLALRYADDGIQRPPPLPVANPKRGATVAFVRDRLAASQPLPALAQALRTERCAQPAAEVEAIVRELYRVLARNRHGIKLVDTSARDHPALAKLWFEGSREGLLALLARYLEQRTATRQLRHVPDVLAAARLVIETTAFWAVHRHWDPHPQTVDETVAEETVVRFIVGTLTRE